ncbi:mitochondrial import receptor subunit TOM22 homolog [Crassostrea angulata]|uniref:Mitochondrial import receptor subunit TOM22 homolog n=1 Tax=Magallana gigas TaxID=29159 RepID=A0A8W8M4Y0_MAGGI|nr:mitochondrial import receptor subunit TOM22 homolog [Crassostrea angulata]|eukprot:XP_011433501.1 PREDICTED: mitochondrial import receptor subunit TOM22 homolog [Crassostrea gigas]
MEIPASGDQIMELTGDKLKELTNAIEDEEDDDEELDETLVERLIGLTEMFPDSVRNAVCSAGSFSWKAMQWSFSFSKSAMWVAVSAGTILVLPVMFENERAQMLDQQKQQEKQILLGPHSAMSGPGMVPPGMLPPGMVPPPPSMAPPPPASS